MFEEIRREIITEKEPQKEKSKAQKRVEMLLRQMKDMDALLTTEEVAKFCKVSPQVIRNWSNEGAGGIKLEVFKLASNHYLVSKEDLAVFLAKLNRGWHESRAAA